MNFFSDVSSMEIDFYYAMASYLIMGGGNSKLSKGTPSNWILPDLARIWILHRHLSPSISERPWQIVQTNRLLRAVKTTRGLH